ncbi:MAG: four-carbon acid sugar kinase family protein [bacterium]|nr:four-carbon acid sugar kinase family protein [bacterium]
MARCVIIADDLTGANATGAMLQKINYSAYTVMNAERLNLSNLETCDCVVYPTDSRASEAKVAYNRVYNVTELLKSEDVVLYSKRIDSTLRGNIGVEADAMLDCLDKDTVAMVVPCFPESGRIVCGGYMLVNNVPLHKTEAAIDPITPVCTSKLEKIYEIQSKYKTGSIYIEDLMKGKEHVIETLKRFAYSGVRAVLFDAVSHEDIDLIADAVIESKIAFIAVDPGPFTATVARKCIIPNVKKEESKILAVVGSVNAVARQQMEEFFLSQEPFHIFAKTAEFVKSKEAREQEISRIVNEVLTNSKDYAVCCVIGDGIYLENRINFSSVETREGEVSSIINKSFASITKRIVDSQPKFHGIYSCGGDITVAISKEFDASGIKLLGEVLPLAAYGEILEGSYDGMKIITKGGMAGGKTAMRDCIQYLKEKLLI